MDTIRMPQFQNEAAEAQWWYDNRHEHAEHWVAAIREGKVGEGSVARRERKVQEAAKSKCFPDNIARILARLNHSEMQNKLIFTVSFDRSASSIEYDLHPSCESFRPIVKRQYKLLACT